MLKFVRLPLVSRFCTPVPNVVTPVPPDVMGSVPVALDIVTYAELYH